jgi:elongation factor 2
MVKNLWGEAYFDPDSKKVVHSVPPGKKLERYTCKMFLGPLFKLINAIGISDWAQIDEMLPRIGVTLPAKDRDSTMKEVMKAIMRRFLPLADSLLDTVFTHLPSPVVAQKYRTEILYDGDLNDEYAKAIRECDPKGPLVAFISKMFPVPNTKAFYAFGRIFSGTVHSGQKIYAIEAGDASKKVESSKNVQRLMPMNIRATDNLEYCPCGNIVALQGIDSLLTKCGTIASSPQASPIKAMKFSVSPVVHAAVCCKNPQDLPKLLEGLRALVTSDSCVQLITEKDSSELIIGTAGDLHLQICMSVLRNTYCKGMDIVESPPMVPFRETVTSRTEPLLAKSPNKHNRIYAEASPLSAELCAAIDDKQIPINEDSKARADMLIGKFGWDDTEAKKKIWCFAPETQPNNTVVDTTKAAQYMNEIKDSVVGAFRWASEEGPLCGEPLRGVRINITDVTLHADAIHRGGGQILPTMQRLTHACVLAAEPRLVEPVYLVEVVTSQIEAGHIYSVIERRRGKVFSEEPRFGTPMCTLLAHIPVLESFGLLASLREATHGQAFAQCSFSHWQILDADPFEEGSIANRIVKQVRARKHLPPDLPKWQEMVDKL